MSRRDSRGDTREANRWRVAMKSRHSSGLLPLVAAGVLIISAGAQGQILVWQRGADWVPGGVFGGTVNNPAPAAGSSSVWQYEYAQGGALGSSNPWYTQATTLMTWDSDWYGSGWGVWSRGDDLNPPVLAGRLVHNVHASAVQDIPIVRWNSPLGPVNDLAITGTLLIDWNGAGGVGLPVDVDVVIARQNAQKTATTMLFSTTVSKPNPFASVGDWVSIPINLSSISVGLGESIIITHRGRGSFSPAGGWVNLHDNVSFTSVPAPGSLGLLTLGALALGRRRRP
jgi:MYXO-CTERM domain-containing protein